MTEYVDALFAVAELLPAVIALGLPAGGQVAGNYVGDSQTSGQEQFPPSAILLTAGDTYGGKHDPQAGEQREEWAGAPHGEAAWIVESDWWTRQDPDGGILRECVQTWLVEEVADRLVLADRQRRHTPADQGDHHSTKTKLAHSQPAHRPARWELRLGGHRRTGQCPGPHRAASP